MLIASAVAELFYYRLHSVVTHDGGMGGGHYMAYVRAEDNSWAWFSDQVDTVLGAELEPLIKTCGVVAVSFSERSMKLKC